LFYALKPSQTKLLHMEHPHSMVSTSPKPNIISPKAPTSHGHAHELHLHPWPPLPWMGSSSPQPIHGTSNTWRRFPTSLESHRNKPYLIWSPNASRIDLNMLAHLLFIVYRMVCHFGGVSVEL
jgi:hypothetical protein